MQYIPFRSLDDVQDTLFYNLEHNPFADWLLKDDWSERKYQQYMLLNSFGPTRSYMDYLLSRRNDTEYLKRYGMDYSDIHDPRKLQSSNSFSGFVNSGLNFVSRNVSKLYR